MSDRTHISWADTTWPVTVGCDKVSSGCYDCYAMRDARRMESNPNPKISSVYSGLVTKQANGILNWTGAIKTLPERLNDPAHWKDHRDIFVCSQSDLFHEDVPGAFIGQVFSAIWNYSWHTYYILTKRPERLLELLEGTPPEGLADFNSINFPHVIVGVSAEDQAAAEKRLPLLTQLPLASSQLFVSAEPLIGPLDLSKWLDRLGWVIAGGESGKHARPMHPDWPRRLRDQCEEARVSYHFKQWGEFTTELPGAEAETTEEAGAPLYRLKPGKSRKPVPTLIQDRTTFYRVGRRKAGRILDSQYWNARPGADYGPTYAPHPLHAEVIVNVSAGPEYSGAVGIITTIRPDNPAIREIDGEEASYWITVGGRELPQAFSYWQIDIKALRSRFV